MADIQFIKIGALPEELLPTDEVSFVIESGESTHRLSLADLKAFLLTDANLLGQPIASTSSAGANNQNLATTEFVHGELAGVGLTAASADNPGTVRTHATAAAPIVYLSSEVDEIVTGINVAQASTVQPVLLGGTGATEADTARGNLEAAQSGANNDILSLQALNSVPDYIKTAYASGANMPIGSILMWPGELASMPSAQWKVCDGSSLAQATYPTLYALIGKFYGGTNPNFLLPNLLGRSPLGAGTGPFGTNRSLASKGGEDTHALTTAEMPIHNHPTTNGAAMLSTVVSGGIWQMPAAGGPMTNSQGIGNAGGYTAHNNLSPYLCLQFIIKVL